MPYAYTAGDYYSPYRAGGYYSPYRAGGLFGFLGGAVSKLGGLLPGPLGAGAKVLGGTLSKFEKNKQTAGGSTALVPVPQQGPIPVPRGAPGAVPVPGAGGMISRLLPGGASGYQGGPATGGAPAGWHWNKSYSYRWQAPAGSFLVRNRSMNTANVSAIRRAARRQTGFLAVARRVASNLGYKVVRSGGARGAKRVFARRK